MHASPFEIWYYQIWADVISRSKQVHPSTWNQFIPVAAETHARSRERHGRRAQGDTVVEKHHEEEGLPFVIVVSSGIK